MTDDGVQVRYSPNFCFTECHFGYFLSICSQYLLPGRCPICVVPVRGRPFVSLIKNRGPCFLQVSSLEVGPTPIGTIVFIFYGPSLPFKAHSHISIYENAYLRVIGELVIPPGKNATFKELSFLWITNSYIGCEVVGECLLNLDQGTIVAYNNGNPSRADFVGLNFRLFQSSYQNTLNSQSQLVFWSCNVDMSVADIRLVSGRYKFITSNHTMDYCNLKLSKDPTQYTYIAWTEGSVATIANTDVGSIGRPLVADSSEVTFDGEGPYAAFTLSDGATLYSQTGSIVTLQRFAKIEMNRGYIMDSTLSSLYLINSVRINGTTSKLSPKLPRQSRLTRCADCTGFKYFIPLCFEWRIFLGF